MFVIAHGICGDIEFSEANKLYSKMVQHFAKCCRCVFFSGCGAVEDTFGAVASEGFRVNNC